MRLLNKPDSLPEPSESKKPLNNIFRNSGFHYSGKDKRGVSRWHGSWDHVLRWLGVIFVCYGGVAGAGAVGMLLYALCTLSWPHAFNPLVFIALTHAVTFGGIGAWSLKMRKHIQSLATSERISDLLGIDPNALEQAAQLNGIKPRMSINDVDYYNPADFVEAMTLLRGASEPTITADVLLRPANGHENTVPAEQLLRPGLAAENVPLSLSHYAAEQSAEIQIAPVE